MFKRRVLPWKKEGHQRQNFEWGKCNNFVWIGEKGREKKMGMRERDMLGGRDSRFSKKSRLFQKPFAEEIVEWEIGKEARNLAERFPVPVRGGGGHTLTLILEGGSQEGSEEPLKGGVRSLEKKILSLSKGGAPKIANLKTASLWVTLCTEKIKRDGVASTEVPKGLSAI